MIVLTMPEAAAAIQRQYGGKPVPIWTLRRIVDRLEADERLEVQRVGPYRTVMDTSISIIAEELHRRGVIGGVA